jgi:hypothetical protein
MPNLISKRFFRYVTSLEITIWWISTLELKIKKLDNHQYGNMNPNKYLLRNVKKKLKTDLKNKKRLSRDKKQKSTK